jgi:N-acetylmuramoyl-L-alanine amidase
VTRSVFVSAGHHPVSQGADDGHGFAEHPEAVLWAELLAADLGERAVIVPTGKLRAKVEFINGLAQPGDCAVEIHFNSATDAAGAHVGAGSETLYCPGATAGHALAQRVQGELAGVFPPDRGAKPGWYRMDPVNGPDFFLQATRCPAIIVEPEFIHHRAMIQGSREEGVRAIAHGFGIWLS